MRWYHGRLSAAAAYARLAGEPVNSYLVRTGSRDSGFVISWVERAAPLAIIHSVVSPVPGGWQMTGDSAVYGSLQELIEHGFNHIIKYPVLC